MNKDSNNKKKLLISPIFLLLLLIFLPMFLLSYGRISNQEMGIWEGYMSIIPPTYLTGNFTPEEPELASIVHFSPSICERYGSCVVCDKCTMDIYKEIDGDLLQEQQNIKINDSVFEFMYKEKPMWVHVILENVTAVRVRIPKPNLLEKLQIMYRGNSSIFDIFAFFGTLISVGAILIDFIQRIVRIIRKNYESYKCRKNPPRYIG
ncbi:MAG: hypothetical protein Q7S55_04595 [Nanoarchaeota archaeon]|nr:hypothetical protein [Nanoarchaeota archaeon]